MSSSISSITTPNDGSQSEGDHEPEYEYQWMDQQCLNPIRSVPGCSRLRDACLWIFQQSPVEMQQDSVQMREGTPVYRGHLRYLGTLLESMMQGCLLCIRLSNVILPKFCPYHFDLNTLNTKIDLMYYRDIGPFGGPIVRLWFLYKERVIMSFNFFCPIRKLFYKSSLLGDNPYL